MKIELSSKQKVKMSSYKFDGTYSELCAVGNIFYIEGMPAFLFLENGEMELITPNGCHIYINNREECDDWLKTHSTFRVKFPDYIDA